MLKTFGKRASTAPVTKGALRRVSAGMVAGAVCLAGLAACGEDKESPSSSGDAKKQTMTAMFVGSANDQAVMDIFKQVTEEFNANNEFNVEFTYETYENEAYKTKLASLMASDSATDVFFTWTAGYLQPFVEGGKVYEIGQLLDKDAEWKDRFNEGAFGPVSFDGKIYAVPHTQAVAVMYYNTRLFEENNVAVPTTYDEFVAAVATFKDAGIAPVSVPVKDAWIAGQFLQQLANDADGIGLYDGTVDGSRKWNDPSYVEAGQMLLDLANMGAFPDGYLGMSNDEGRDLFIQEKAAMYYMGSWDTAMIGDSASLVSANVGVFNIPPKDPSAGNVAVGDMDQVFAVSANSKNPEAAAAFIKLFSDTAAQEAYAYNAQLLPATRVQLDSSKLSPLSAAITELQSGFTGVTPWLDRVFGAGEGVEFNNAAQAIIAGEDPKTKLDELQAFAEANAER
ncbi:MAG: extracellular solute-binding protein [Bifidobacteriaceae bacterium]|jgi:raffinose/stachyose/melibiose transport system substrate-binding protein|nr:extracellular solute-binding protein [Bifidobacteriaceae bacterium]